MSGKNIYIPILLLSVMALPAFSQETSADVYDEYGEVKKEFLDSDGNVRADVAEFLASEADNVGESEAAVAEVKSVPEKKNAVAPKADKPSWAKDNKKEAVVTVDLGDGVITVEEAEGIRDPFLPVGYSAEAPVEEIPDIVNPAPGPAAPVVVALENVTEEHWKLAERDAGIVPKKYSLAKKSGKSLILINGRIISEGGTYSRDYMGVKFTWKIKNVTNSSAEFDRLDIESTGAGKK